MNKNPKKKKNVYIYIYKLFFLSLFKKKGKKKILCVLFYTKNRELA